VRGKLALDLYLVTNRNLCAARGIERVVQEAVAGGVTMVQLRDDETPAAGVAELARRLVALLAPAGVPLIVNNRVDVAAASGAAGAHVGQGDAPPAEARGMLGAAAILGLSITDPGQLAAVDPKLVDYLGVGPVFATATKPDAAPAIGTAGLAACRARTALPIVGIGGIDRGNAASVVEAGADGVAVVSAICGAADPAAAARDLVQVMTATKASRRRT
jgi:thiamine-phosphate pyrophosphorylase